MTATVRILILAGFLSAPEEDEETGQLTRWEKVTRAVRFVVAGLIWALTWILPDIHDHDVLGVRERRAPLRSARHHPLRR